MDKWYIYECYEHLTKSLFKYVAHNIPWLDVDDFVVKFMKSGVRSNMDALNPMYMNISTGEEMYGIFKKNTRFNPLYQSEYNYYDYSSLIPVVAEFYSYFTYKTGMPSCDVINALPFGRVYDSIGMILHRDYVDAVEHEAKELGYIVVSDFDDELVKLSPYYKCNIVIDGKKFNSVYEYLIYMGAQVDGGFPK